MSVSSRIIFRKTYISCCVLADRSIDDDLWRISASGTAEYYEEVDDGIVLQDGETCFENDGRATIRKRWFTRHCHRRYFRWVCFIRVLSTFNDFAICMHFHLNLFERWMSRKTDWNIARCSSWKREGIIHFGSTISCSDWIIAKNCCLVIGGMGGLKGDRMRRGGWIWIILRVWSHEMSEKRLSRMSGWVWCPMTFDPKSEICVSMKLSSFDLFKFTINVQKSWNACRRIHDLFVLWDWWLELVPWCHHERAHAHHSAAQQFIPISYSKTVFLHVWMVHNTFIADWSLQNNFPFFYGKVHLRTDQRLKVPTFL